MHRRWLHPVHAVWLGGTASLFLGALFGDIAYAASYEVQWKNLASWSIVGGLVLGSVTLLWALVGFFHPDQRERRQAVYFLLLLAAWLLALMNALVHAEDAWASMPEALILSAIVAVLALAATGFGFSTVRVGGMQ